MHIERAFLIKHPNVPTKLYKYRCFSCNHIEAFEKNILWMSSPDRFNDPYDAAVHFEPGRFLVEDRTVDEYLKHAETLKKNFEAGIEWQPEKIKNPIASREWLSKMTDELLKGHPVPARNEFMEVMAKILKTRDEDAVRRMASFFRNSYSVLSLSENPAATLMWSHYSDSHRGFAIEYDFSNLGYHDLRRRLCFPIFYTRKPRDATRYMARTDMSDYNNLFGLYMCLIKKDEWAYEKEWRILHAIGASHANSELTMPTPSAVLLGADVAPNDEAMMSVLCRTRAIPLKRMVRKSNSYDMSVIDLPI